MLTMYFDRGRSHVLNRVASEPDQKRLVGIPTVCATNRRRNEKWLLVIADLEPSPF